MKHLVPLGVLFAACVFVGAPPQWSRNETRSAVAIVDGRLVDRTFGYSFALPDGWTLHADSEPGKVTVVHEGSRSSFFVGVKPAQGSLSDEYQAMGLAIPLLGGRWSRVSDGRLKLDGRRAKEIVSTRRFPDGESLQCRNIVVVNKPNVYLIDCRESDEYAAQRTGVCKAILDSFAWEAAPKGE